jgi:hypothetical protein
MSYLSMRGLPRKVLLMTLRRLAEQICKVALPTRTSLCTRQAPQRALLSWTASTSDCLAASAGLVASTGDFAASGDLAASIALAGLPPSASDSRPRSVLVKVPMPTPKRNSGVLGAAGRLEF